MIVSTVLCNTNIFFLNKRLKIFINYFLGPVLFIWLSFSIYHQIQQQQNLQHTWQTIIHSFKAKQWMLLLLVILLMFINWGLEAVKWQYLMRNIQTVNFGKAFKAIFAGQAFAFNTVNNVGEYLGRMFFLDEGNRLRSISLTMVGSLSQLIVTFVMGIAGLFYMRWFMLDAASIKLHGLSLFWLQGLTVILIAVTIVLLILYYALAWCIKVVEKIPFVSKYIYLIQKIEELHSKQLTKILLLSFIRYVVFVIQYLLLLNVFSVEGSSISFLWLVCVKFLVLAVIPSIAMAELGLRGEIGVQLFGLLSNNLIGIIFTTVGIWLINRMLPAVIGALLILSVRIFKNR
ncbi:MAG: flippase-like domain-containing protein [Bacteroidetes bacterium]|nr:flippase-like domain-containing protein [Bacteroidota bacterium]